MAGNDGPLPTASAAEVRVGDGLVPLRHRMESAIGDYFGSDPRVTSLGAAYVEWPNGRPTRCRMRIALTCHQCGSELTQDRSGFPGFISGTTDPCGRCGNRIEISNYREWDNDRGRGLWIFATPYTTNRGADIRPIEVRSLEIENLD